MKVFIFMFLLICFSSVSAMDQKRNDLLSFFILDAIMRGDCSAVKKLAKAPVFDASTCDVAGRNLLFATIPSASQNLFRKESVVEKHLKMIKAVPNIIECLIKQGVNQHKQDIYGFNMLMLLMHIPPEPQIYLLHVRDTSVEEYKKQHRSYIHKTVETLLNGGMSVTAQDKAGRTVCHHAARGSGDIGSMKLLIEHKANLWQQDSDGNTCLHDIARYGRVDLAELMHSNETHYQKHLSTLMMLIYTRKGGTKWMPRLLFRTIIDRVLRSGLFAIKNTSNKMAFDIAHEGNTSCVNRELGDWFFENRFYGQQEWLERHNALINLLNPTRLYYVK